MKVCGPDGCGGSCGTCSAPNVCSADGKCVCTPESDAAFCSRLARSCGVATGNDNCGQPRSVICGSCAGTQSCGGAGVAGQCGCTPQCQGKVCGSDSCGGTCGACPGNSTCGADQTSCGCNAGYLPDPGGNACVQAGVASSALTAYPANGYCIGSRYWLIPDRVRGLFAIDCGNGQCQPDGNGGNSGSCTCGSAGSGMPALTTSGFCPQGALLGPAFGAHEVVLTCFAGQSYYDNCIQRTGLQTAVCSTFVTSFGHNASCHCGPCQAYDPNTHSCRPFCPSGYTCGYDAATSTTMCN
jgi:hypothetical protein